MKDEVLGILTEAHPFNLDHLQKTLGSKKFCVCDSFLHKTQGQPGICSLSLRYLVWGKGADVVWVWDGKIFVLEFKTGEKHYPKHALDQVLDYCLDLKNFHKGSLDKVIVPVLVSTNAPSDRIHS